MLIRDHLHKKMAALMSYLMSLIRDPYPPQFIHPFKLPFPPEKHQVLDEAFVKKYKEVLIIGDVHGCYDEMVKLLEEANAMNDSVLKIFVGDLVNKGPKNKEVLEILRNMPSALSVRGNHDEVVLREIKESNKPSYKLANKNLWMKDLSDEQIEYLSNLPYTITIPSLNAIIVHAGVIPGKPLECIHPMYFVTMRNIVMRDYFWDGGILATKHTTCGEPWASLWSGPNHVYFGHDAKRLLQLYPYATGLDTGCVYGKKLTAVFINGPRKGTFISVNSKKVYEKPKGEIV